MSSGPAGAAGYADELERFHHTLAALPPRHPRVIGLWLLRLSGISLLACLCLRPAGANIALGAGAVGFILSRPPLRGMPGVIPGILFVLWVLVTVLCAWTRGATITVGGLGVLHTWTAACLVQVALAHRPTLRWATIALATMTVISALLALGQFVIGLGGHPPLRIDPHGPRFFISVGFQDVHLTQGYVMALTALALPALAAAAALPRAFAIAATIAAGIAMLISQARTAYAGMAAGIFAMIAARGRRHLLRAAAAAAAMLLVAAGVMTVWRPEQVRNLLRGDDGRWAIWRTSALVAADHALLGVGSNEAFKFAYLARYDEVACGRPNEFRYGAPHAHNSVLTLTSRHGLPALALYLMLWVALAHAAWSRRLERPAAWRLTVGALALAAVAGIFEDLICRASSAFALFAILGAAQALAHLRPQAEPAQRP